MNRNFTLQEVIHSRVDDFPEELRPIAYNAMGYLQALRDHLGVSIIVTSGYRSLEYNQEIGGSKNSYHVWRYANDMKFIWAVDIYSPEMDIKDFYQDVKDFVIGETYWHRDKGFIHISPYGKDEEWVV